MERSVIHLLEIIKKPLTEEELNEAVEHDAKCNNESDPYSLLIMYFHNKNTEAFVKCSLFDLSLYLPLPFV